jgi:hypothetical protein
LIFLIIYGSMAKKHRNANGTTTATAIVPPSMVHLALLADPSRHTPGTYPAWQLTLHAWQFVEPTASEKVPISHGIQLVAPEIVHMSDGG